MARKSKIQNHNSGIKPPSGPPAEGEYKVGPGRPPKEYQFKPGQSGNPKGAKRKPRSLIPDLKKIFERAFNQKVTVTQGERQRVITMWAAGMRQLAIQFAKGDRHARRDVFWIAERLGSDFLAAKESVRGNARPGSSGHPRRLCRSTNKPKTIRCTGPCTRTSGAAR